MTELQTDITAHNQKDTPPGSEAKPKREIREIREIKKLIGRLALVGGLAAGSLTGCEAHNVRDSTPTQPENTPATTTSISHEMAQPLTVPEPERLNGEALPDDVVPRQELFDTYRVRIYDSPSGVNLHIRREALAQEEAFQFLRDYPQLHLDIVLLDCPRGSKWTLSDEQRRLLPPDIVEEFDTIEFHQPVQEERDIITAEKQSRIKDYGEWVNRIHEMHKIGVISEQDMNVYLRGLRWYFEPYLVSEKDLTTELINRVLTGNRRGGMMRKPDMIIHKSHFFRERSITLKSSDEGNDHFIIWLPVGNDSGYLDWVRTRNEFFNGLLSYYDHTDRERAENTFLARPSISDQYRTPDETYMTPGFSLRHEFRHMAQIAREVKNFKLLSEYDTPGFNVVLRRMIDRAIKRALNGDDTGLYFIFETNQGNILGMRDAEKKVVMIDKDDTQRNEDAVHQRHPVHAYEVRGHDVASHRARANIRSRAT